MAGRYPANSVASLASDEEVEMKILDIIRACVRPFIAISGWAVFLVIVIIIMNRFLDAEMAKQFAYVFTGAITTIIGVYIGERKAKKEAEGK
jgi:hypothetical protein